MAASKSVPEVTWQEKSVVRGNFSCRGRTEYAILGTTTTDIVLAVFLNKINKPTEVLRYSAQMRDATTAELTIESLDGDDNEP